MNYRSRLFPPPKPFGTIIRNWKDPIPILPSAAAKLGEADLGFDDPDFDDPPADLDSPLTIDVDKRPEGNVVTVGVKVSHWALPDDEQ